MSEIFVLAFAQAKPGCPEKLEKAFRAAMPPTHAEPGCIKYALQRSQENKNEFVMVEKWSSKEALDNHLKTPHIQALFKQLPDLLAAPIRIQVLDSIREGSPEKLI
ncbi:MAG TPA: putative quinol monooxygenase [Candidatus Omnitrophota bacterium]|nr:antibiotic biosynthesis monooxygenase [Candidatus Omnitrophota bacterium]HRK61428.1 putative quinol monooxygenase [Candidatus Omnitrophota bacterium]